MKQVILAGLLGLGITGYMFAQDHPEHPKSQPDEPTEAKVIAAKVTGENICLGCMLKKEKGAAAQCSKYGHRHALRVTGATEAGKDLPEMKGWVLHYLDTDNGQPFIKEHHSETLILEGQVYTQERVLEVKKQTAAKKPEHPEHPKK